jgi:hypothetical protein
VSDEDVDRLIRGELVEDWTMTWVPRFAPLPSSSQEHRVEASQSPRGHCTTPRTLQHGFTTVAASQPPRGPSDQQSRVTSVAPIRQPEFGQGRCLAERIGPSSGQNIPCDIARQRNADVVDNSALRMDAQAGEAPLSSSSRNGGRQSEGFSASFDSLGRVSMVSAGTPEGFPSDMTAIRRAVDFMAQTNDGSKIWAVIGVNRKIPGNGKNLFKTRSIRTPKPMIVNRSQSRRTRSRVSDQEGDGHSVHMDLDEVDESYVEESDFDESLPAASLDRSLHEIVDSRGDRHVADDHFVEPPLGRVDESAGDEDQPDTLFYSLPPAS